jgi:hypothetical protein
MTTWLCGLPKPPGKITKPPREMAKRLCETTKPPGDVAESLCRLAVPLCHTTKPLCHVTKGLCETTKRFCQMAKRLCGCPGARRHLCNVLESGNLQRGGTFSACIRAGEAPEPATARGRVATRASCGLRACEVWGEVFARTHAMPSVCPTLEKANEARRRAWRALQLIRKMLTLIVKDLPPPPKPRSFEAGAPSCAPRLPKPSRNRGAALPSSKPPLKASNPTLATPSKTPTPCASTP